MKGFPNLSLKMVQYMLSIACISLVSCQVDRSSEATTSTPQPTVGIVAGITSDVPLITPLGGIPPTKCPSVPHYPNAVRLKSTYTDNRRTALYTTAASRAEVWAWFVQTYRPEWDEPQKANDSALYFVVGPQDDYNPTMNLLVNLQKETADSTIFEVQLLFGQTRVDEWCPGLEP